MGMSPQVLIWMSVFTQCLECSPPFLPHMNMTFIFVFLLFITGKIVFNCRCGVLCDLLMAESSCFGVGVFVGTIKQLDVRC